MNHNIIITCALTGAGDTVDKHPAIPVTPYNVENTVTLNIFDLNNKQRKIRISSNEKVFAPHTMDKTTLKSIQDPDCQFYKDFFIKLDKEEFIIKQNL